MQTPTKATDSADHVAYLSSEAQIRGVKNLHEQIVSQLKGYIETKDEIAPDLAKNINQLSQEAKSLSDYQTLFLDTQSKEIDKTILVYALIKELEKHKNLFLKQIAADKEKSPEKQLGENSIALQIYLKVLRAILEQADLSLPTKTRTRN